MPTKVIMPQLGESVVEGTVVKWLKARGEKIANMESLLEVETDKVVTEIPSPAEGVLLAVLVPEGTTVKAGTVIGWVGQPGEAVPEMENAPALEAVPGVAAIPRNGGSPQHSNPRPLPGGTESAVSPKEAALASPGGQRTPARVAAAVGLGPAPAAGRDLGFISPVVARIAREHDVNLEKVKGTGAGGRITKKDVLAYVEGNQGAGTQASGIPAWETPADGDLFRPTELVFGTGEQPAPGTRDTGTLDTLVPHTTIRKQIAEHMLASKKTSPHVTTVMEADLSRVVAHREANRAVFARDGVKLTYTAYFVAASAAALKAHPLVNSSWSETGVLVHAAINIGMAASLGEEGLIVPVIKNADGLSLLGIARAVDDLAERARTRKLQPEEVRGGTFTITNHGTSGSLFATPIINQPQCAILGVGAIQKRAVVINDAIAIRPMVYISLTFDHRILDGASADWFLAKVKDALENWA